MITMSIIMVISAIGCFVGSIIYARKEAELEELEREKNNANYNVTFADELFHYGYDARRSQQ